jgi:hypothetical protein
VPYDLQVVRDEQVAEAESCCRSDSRLSTWAWIDTSSAETGSSQMISLGRSASARATPIRWRCPPENSEGNRL